MQTRILPPTDENLDLAAAALRRGEVVAMPTETVYGLAGAALDERALTKIFSVKERPTFDPLIVHLALPTDRKSGEVDWLAYLDSAGLVDASALAPRARERVQALAARFWPGPLTLVLPKRPRVPDLATSGLPTVALRAPRHPVAQGLIARAGVPLAAPSANRFGRISPTAAEDVLAELGGRIELILDGGRCEVGLESTVVAVADDGALALLRPGGTPVGELEAAAGTKLLTPTTNHRPPTTKASSARPAAPGMLKSHYAPTKRLILLPTPVAELRPSDATRIADRIAGKRGVGVLLQAGRTDAARAKLEELLPSTGVAWEIESLSPAGDAAEAARRLFAALRALDASPAVELILAEPVLQTTGLGHAIADRLRRASA
jgi:L-threonylcarbamoyladenylate synthase